MDLDSPVQHYLPWFRLADADASNRLTVQQLLNHTSGIPSSALYKSWATPDLTLAEYGRELATELDRLEVASQIKAGTADHEGALRWPHGRIT
jgi:CubicO group peptidase (beta-lactamase class C family)